MNNNDGQTEKKPMPAWVRIAGNSILTWLIVFFMTIPADSIPDMEKIWLATRVAFITVIPQLLVHFQDKKTERNGGTPPKRTLGMII